MKKKSLLIVCVILCLIALASLSSCGNIKAVSVWSKVSRAMDKLESYEMNISTRLVYYIEGNKVTADGDGHAIVDGIGGDDFYYYLKQDIQTTAPDLEIDQSSTAVEAYTGGYYYVRNKTRGVDNKICGEMSYKDFTEYVDTSAIPSFNLSGCKKVQTKKHSDGTRTITCSEYNSGTVEEIVECLGAEAYIFGYNVKDVKISVTYDKDFRIKRMTYAFVFDVSEGITKRPSFSMSATYTKYNEAERTEEYIKKSGYTEVENIKLLNDIQNKLNELAINEKGRFSVEIEESFTTFGVSAVYKEKSHVDYGSKRGKFYYDISSVINDEEYTIKYGDGKQITRGATSKDRDQTEQEAREFIMNLMNPAGFRRANISNIVSKGGGEYELECRSLNFLAYKSLLESNDIIYQSSTQKITVKVASDGEIVRIESEIAIDGKISEKNVSVGARLVVKTKNSYN